MNSNNPIHLNEQLRQLIEWLNVIVLGGQDESLIVGGVNKPSISKSIYQHFSSLQSMVQGRLAYPSKFDLQSAGAPPSDIFLAEVWNDPSKKNNGLYGWTGTAWQKSTMDVLGTTMEVLNSRVEDTATSGDIEYAICDKHGRAVMSVTKSGRVALTSVVDLAGGEFEQSETAGFSFAIVDKQDRVAFGIGENGEVSISNTETFSFDDDLSDYAWGVVDSRGRVALAITKSSELFYHGKTDAKKETYKTFDLSSAESIVHVGDSHTASHYALEDKAYISNLSAFSPYRHQNFGISGDDALDMNQRIVEQTAYFDGKTFADMNANYAFIATRDNDGQFISADLTYWQANMARLVDSVKASGIAPILCTEFNCEATEYGVHQAVAAQLGIPYVDNASLAFELGGLKRGPFHQGHPGTRTNGVFWLEMLNMVDRLPRPEKSIKVFRKRGNVTASSVTDLLYHDRIDRFTKFKELSLTHYHLGAASREHCDELDGDDVYNFALKTDEYWKLQKGQAVDFEDYGLIEIILPGTATTLESVNVDLGLPSDVDVYVRDYLDEASNIVGKKAGTTPTSADYQARWNAPTGAWRKVSTLTLTKAELKHSLSYDTLTVLLYRAGGFSLHGVTVNYLGEGKKAFLPESLKPVGNELLPAPGFSPSESASWLGDRREIVPIDQYNAPRHPTVRAQPVERVAVISPGQRLLQSINVPVDERRQYRVRVWCRHFPKAYLDNSHYGLDPEQVIDSSQAGVTFDTHAELTESSVDVRRVQLEWWAGTEEPAKGGARLTDFACLAWRPVDFYLYLPAAPLGTGTVSFSLSSPDGEIQIAKVSVKEVL
ncbi:SGNH/GDSL hydrolase family protein [Grimontia hollisae]|uniref:SGNH/GDSL hydrolase family protein n=1 Tax=Grimontia hollisae TaxID=673 RepID=UPI000DFC48F7|nr:hypothetical protein [Grimontia hollisae]STQ75543.1 Uncharacterised protein [Grimontia hollisae]